MIPPNITQKRPITGTPAALRIAVMASFLLATGVLLGAFGSHGLKSNPAIVATLEQSLMLWQTATLYFFIHALGLLFISGFLHLRWCNTRPALCLMMGMALFSGSLYAMALGYPRGLGVVTPVGGSFFVVGWGLLGVQLYGSYKKMSA